MDRSAGELEEGGPWLGDDEQRAWRLLVVMLTVLPAAFDRRLRRGSGLTLFAYGVLATLSEAPARALAMSDLAAVTHASLSRLSQVVTGLERDGRVVRLPLSESGRVTMVRLTAAGTCVFETAAQMHAIEVRRLVFEALDRDQVDSLARMCSAILDGLGARTLDEGPTTRRPYRRDGEAPRSAPRVTRPDR